MDAALLLSDLIGGVFVIGIGAVIGGRKKKNREKNELGKIDRTIPYETQELINKQIKDSK